MKTFFLFCTFLISLTSVAQISSYFNGDAKDFIELKSRNLIVETLEENPKVLKDLEKPKNAEKLIAYRRIIKLYNQDIISYAKKYWILNTNIEFKSESEVEKLKKENNKSFAILRNLKLNDIDFDFHSDLFVSALVYTPIEAKKSKPYSQAYFPVVSNSDKFLLTEADYKFMFTVLQSNIEYIIENKSNENSENYLRKMAEKNCPLVKNKTLLVKESLLHSSTTKEKCLKQYDGKLQLVSEDELSKAFVEKQKDKVVMFSVPYEIAKASFGPIGQSTMTSYKVIVDCETNKILYMFAPKGFAVMGQNLFQFMIEKDFENIKKCK